MILSFDKKSIRVEVNASTLIIYEDRFKGRRLMQDLYMLSTIENIDEIPLALISKLFWAAAKTADNNIPDLYEWLEQFEISDIIGSIPKIIPIYSKNIETVKKQTAAAKLKRIFQRLKFWRLRPNSD